MAAVFLINRNIQDILDIFLQVLSSLSIPFIPLLLFKTTPTRTTRKHLVPNKLGKLEMKPNQSHKDQSR
jgi:hypothetical protein